MSVNEQLGITINVDIDKVQARFTELGNILNKTFQVDGLARLVEQMNKMEGASSKAASGFKAASKDIENFAKAFTNGDIDKAKQKMESLYDSKKMKQWSRDLAGETKKVAGAFDFLGTTMGRMAGRLTEFYGIRAVLFGVSNQFQAAVTSSLDFNQSVHDILAISGESKDGLGGIGKSIWDIAKASKFSAKEVSDLMQVLAQAGVKGDQLPGVANAVGKFATGAGADPKLAADLFTTTMNVYNLTADSSMRITNALTAALNNSKLEANGLATAFNYLAPQAAQLGMTMEGTLGIISTMAQSGVKASTIGTGVSQMLKEFAAPKGRLKSLLEYYGLTKDNIDPLKHSFADIVDSLNNAKGKAGETGVAVQHLFAALESRVGRSAIAAINLGGDAFRNMENSITGTSAALIAYDKSMEGARARMNVLQQTFHSFISGTLDNLAPMFIVAMNAMRGFLSIMDTEGGKFVAAGLAVATTIGVIVVAANALKAAMAASTALNGGGFLANLLGGTRIIALLTNPVAIVAGLVAIGVAIVGMGNFLDRGKQQEEEATKATLKNIEAKQGYVNILQGIKTGMESQNKGLREYSDLLLLEGKESVKVKKLGDTLVTLKDDQRRALSNYIAKYPDLFKGMDLEITKYGQLINVIGKYNTAKFGDSAIAADKYNKILQEAATQYKKDLENGEARNTYSAEATGRAVDTKTVAQQKIDAKAKFDARMSKEDVTALRDSATNGSVSNNIVVRDPKTGKNKIRTDTTNIFPGDETVVDPSLSIRYLTAKTSRGIDDKIVGPGPEKPVKVPKGSPHSSETEFGKVEEYVKSLINKSEERQAKDEKDIAERVMVDKLKSKEEREQAYQDAQLLIDLEFTEKYIEEKRKLDAKANGWSVAPRVGAVRDEGIKAINATLAADKKNALDALAVKYDKDPTTTKESAPKTIAAVKSADAILIAEGKALAIQKERVWVATDVYKLDQQQAANEVKNSEAKETAYSREATYLEGQKEKYKGNEKELVNIEARIETNNEAHKATVLLLEEQRVKLQKIKDANPWTSFTDGARAALRTATDLNAMSSQLGSSITGSAINGIGDTAFNAFGYSAAKEQQKSDIKTEINKLNTQKAELEASIASASAGSFRTPEQAMALSNQKVQLTAINDALKKQQDALRGVQNSWQNFGEGLKKVMVGILEEIQKFIIKMLVAKMVTSLFDMFGSAAISGGYSSTTGTGSFGGSGGSAPYGGLMGGNTLKFAEGGQVPLNLGTLGQDSVLSYLSPGEFVLKRSSVDAIGVDRLNALNAQRFANGGLVGAASDNYKASQKSSLEGQEITFNLFNIADVKSIPPVSGQTIINHVGFDINSNGPLYRQLKMKLSGN